MAYILGFLCADGCIFINPRGSHYIGFYSNDKILIGKIKKCLDSDHKVSERLPRKRVPKKSYELQIGSKEMFNDLANIGITQNKSKVLSFPNIPDLYFADFVRGYFDGDGSVACGYYNKSDRSLKSPALLVRFISGSRKFLEGLQGRLNGLGINGSVIYYSGAYRLSYSTRASRKLFNFMYNTDNNTDLYLKRKFATFLKDREIKSLYYGPVA